MDNLLNYTNNLDYRGNTEDMNGHLDQHHQPITRRPNNLIGADIVDFHLQDNVKNDRHHHHRRRQHRYHHHHATTFPEATSDLDTDRKINNANNPNNRRLPSTDNSNNNGENNSLDSVKITTTTKNHGTA